jgi:hypothetical protein
VGAGVREMSVVKGYALSDILAQVCKYAKRIGLPQGATADLLVALADVEYVGAAGGRVLCVLPRCERAGVSAGAGAGPHICLPVSRHACARYRLAFSTSDKLQLGSMVAAFASAKAALVAHKEAEGEE